MNEAQFLTLGTRTHLTTEIVVHHNNTELDATDVVRHIQLLKVQAPDKPFVIENPTMAKFLEDHNLIKGSDTEGYTVNHDNAERREKILDIVCEHIDGVFKKSSESYPNGKIVIKDK